MINLLKYYAKKRLYIVGIISIIFILLSLLIFQDGFMHGTITDGHPMNNPINTIGEFAVILSIIIPLFEFSFKMRKVGVDEFYKFPISRKKLYLTKYIVGFLEVIIPIILLWLFMLLRIVFSRHMFILKYYYLYIVVLISLIFLIYSIVTFVYSKCNTIYDGLICVFLVSLMTFALGEVADTFFDNFDLCISYSSWFCPNTSDFFIFSPIIFVSEEFTELVNYLEGIEFRDSQIVSLVVYSILGTCSFILLVFLSDKEKAENSMDISTSWFSYKTIIPIYIVYLTTDIANEFIYIILVVILSYIAYAIYRRSFKIQIRDIITTVSCIVFGIIISNLGIF